MTKRALAWPIYRPATIEKAPKKSLRCGGPKHKPDCLCDVDPAKIDSKPLTYVGAYTYETTARTALESRGVTNPTALDVMCQMLAITDAVQPIKAKAAEIVAIVDNLPPKAVFVDPYEPRQDEDIARRESLRAVVGRCPTGCERLLGQTVDSLVATIWRVTPEQVQDMRNLAMVHGSFRQWKLALAERDYRPVGLSVGNAAMVDTPYLALRGETYEQYLSRNGRLPIPSDTPRSNDKAALARQLVADGWSQQKVANFVGAHYTTVYRWVAGTRRAPKQELVAA